MSIEPISKTAEEAVRVNFNPSGNPKVAALKQIAAAFITACEGLPDSAARERAVAITNMQTASMWAVLAATKEAKP